MSLRDYKGIKKFGHGLGHGHVHEKINTAAMSLLILVCCFFVWEYASASSGNLWLVLPQPTKIFATFFTRFDRILFHAFATFQEMIAALFLAMIASIPLVAAMSRLRLLGGAVQIFFILFQSIPAFCLSPLLVMWFGWGVTTIVLPTALMMLFPITLSIYRGLYAAPEALTEYFRFHQATKSQLFFKLQLPYALPYFFSGLRIALAMSGIGAIAGEWAGAERGLGVLMIESRQSMDFEMTFAALFALILMTVTLYLMGIFFEKRSKSMYKTVASILFAIALSCSSCQQQTPQTHGEAVHLVLDWLPNPNHVPLYAGQKLHFFEEEGIALKITKADALDPLQPLLVGRVDLVISYFPRTMAACMKSASVKMVGKLIQEPLDSVIVLDESPIRKPEDLSGKLVGLSDSHFTTGFFQALFSQYGKEPPKKQNVNFDLATALISKQVDAIYGAFWNIEPEQIASFGIQTRSFPVTAFGVPDYDELVIVAASNTKWSSDEFVQRFQRALQKSIDYSIAHPDEAFELYMQANPDKGDKIRSWEEKAWKKTIPTLATSQQFSKEQMETFMSWLKKMNIL